VKSLAAQTERATSEIAEHIKSMQDATGNAVVAVHEVGRNVNDVNRSAATIASAIDEQSSATREISYSVQQVAAGTTEVSSNISGVRLSADTAGSIANGLVTAVGSMEAVSVQLRGEVQAFFQAVRAA
jgi:methyl-accepting chemotaxis protein